MPLFLYNCTISTSRQTYNSTTKVTGVYAPSLTGVLAHVSSSTELKADHAGMFHAEYTVRVDSGTDIAIGDRLTAIIPFDSSSAWQLDYPQSNVVFVVRMVKETSPMALASRVVFVEKVVTKGPAH